MNERKRSRAYPGTDLAGSIENLKQIQEKLGLGMQSRDDLLKALGHTAESGAFNRKVGAMVLFGLLDKSTAGYQITTLGKRILRPLPGEEQALHEEAFFRVPLYREVGDQYKPEGRLPGHIDRLLERNFGILAPNGSYAARTLMSSGQFAGVLGPDGAFLSANGGDHMDEPPEPEHARPTGNMHTQKGMIAGPDRTEIRMENPQVVLQTPAKLSTREVEKIKRWLEAVVNPWLGFLAENDDEAQEVESA